ncbi:MAG: transglutaminase-like cysteine peptidase [Desulfocapsaceae bacterium]|nr:transglutaminase-like cysteine peptidase [Desulfocapsaceae bacterium]
MNKKRRAIFTLLLSAVTLVIFLLFLSGCGTKKKVPAEAVTLDAGQQRIVDWHVLIKEQRDAPEMEKLKSVNDFFNRLEFVDDLDHWGKDDYWATPQEMLVSNGGDCEDFATAKYFTLRQLAIPDEKLRLVYVKSLELKQPHMVLSYYAEPTSDPLIMDNLVSAILFASQRTDLIPVYSFNAQGLWLTKKERSERLGGAERLSLWQALQSRFNQEILAAPLSQ